MTLATVLVLFIIAVELYRPIIVGNAIDQYINGYYHPYVKADVSAPDAINWNGLVLSRDQAVSKADSASFYQIFLWKDHYYMAENLTRSECTALQNADTSVLKNYVREGAQKLTSNDLKILRQNDFKGILKAGILFLLLLFSGFFLNLADTWLLQKMGQQIVYKLREETFTHIHSLSLSFFNITPVGKLVTRVSNDTEAVNELFSTILVKLFKNVVKIIGYAVVMLSINVKMAGISFLLLPLVAILTFVFRQPDLCKEQHDCCYDRNDIDIGKYFLQVKSFFMAQYIFTVCPEKDGLNPHNHTCIKHPLFAKHKCHKRYDHIS